MSWRGATEKRLGTEHVVGAHKLDMDPATHHPKGLPVGTVHLIKTEKVPAGHRKLIPVIVRGGGGPELLLFEPGKTARDIVLADAIIESGYEFCATKVIENRGTTPIHLDSGMELGTVTPVEELGCQELQSLRNPEHALEAEPSGQIGPSTPAENGRGSYSIYNAQSTQVLCYPDFSRPFILETDASGVGLGAVLAQEQTDGAVKPIAYASRSIQKHERNYGITELEGLGVVWAVKYFRAYLYGHRCTLYTDHEALKSLLNTTQPSGKLARWGMAIQELDLNEQLAHKRGVAGPKKWRPEVI